MGDRRVKSFVYVEGKSFEIEYWRNSEPEEEVGIIERGRGRVFSSNLTIVGARWVGKLLCQISISSTAKGTTFIHEDRHYKIKATVKSNEWGLYVHSLISPKKKGSRSACLCFPSGLNQEGWALFGEKIRDILPIQREITTPPAQFHLPNVGVRSEATYATVCASKGNEGNPYISFRSGSAVLGASWWLPVILCRYDGVKPDWFWVRERIRSVCGEVTLKITQEGEAILVFQEEKDKDKLLSLPPLSTWEGTFSFRRWGPRDGALDLSHLNGDVNVKFIGIPYHLQVRSVVEALAKKCGTDFSIEDNSIDICKATCSIIVRNCDWRNIPRVITVEERGYVVQILVEISRFNPADSDFLTGILPEFKCSGEGRDVVDQASRVPMDISHVAPPLTTSVQSFPPGFEPHNSNQGEDKQPDNLARLFGRSTNLFAESQPVKDVTVIVKKNRNRFEPLVLLENSKDKNPAVSACGGNVFSTDGGSHNHSSQAFEDNVRMTESEPIMPFVKPTGYRPRKHGKKFRKSVIQGPFPATHNRRWIAGTQWQNKSFIKGCNRAQVSKEVGEVQGLDGTVVEKSPSTSVQDKSLTSRIQTFPSPATSSNSFVPNTAFSKQEKGEAIQRVQPQIPSREELAASLLACNTDEDYRTWIRWMVVSFSGEVGMTSSVETEGQAKFCSELEHEMGDQFRMRGENQQFVEGARVQLSDAIVTNEEDVPIEEPILQDVQPNIEGCKEVVTEGCQQMGVIAESIYSGKTKEDKENFVDFFVIPFAKELGMTTSLSKEGQKRMFLELASQS